MSINIFVSFSLLNLIQERFLVLEVDIVRLGSLGLSKGRRLVDKS